MSTSSAGGIARGRRPVEFDPPICATKPTTSRTAERSSGMGWDGVNGVYGWMVDGRRRRGRAGGRNDDASRARIYLCQTHAPSLTGRLPSSCLACIIFLEQLTIRSKLPTPVSSPSAPRDFGTT
jgi:hypothetical protein